MENEEKFQKEFGDLIEHQVYEANNRDGSLYKIEGDKNELMQMHQKEKYIIDINVFLSWLYAFFFILIVCLIVYDLFTYITNKNKENKIEREYCLLVYISLII